MSGGGLGRYVVSRGGRGNSGYYEKGLQSSTIWLACRQHAQPEPARYVIIIIAIPARFCSGLSFFMFLDTENLVCIKVLVIRATPVIPDMKVAFFRCLICNHTVQVEIDRGKIDEPAACPRDVCASVGTMSLVHNRCEFADRQVIRLQETPDAVPDGQTPHTVSLSVYDELVDVAKPGDRLVVTGIFRSV